MPCQTCKEFKEKHVRYKAKTVTKEEMKILGFDPDYSLLCVLQGSAVASCPLGGNYCTAHAQCTIQTCPSNSCPPPLPNSHQLWNDCQNVVGVTCRNCVLATSSCRMQGTCVGSGHCYYDCDPGYVWNGVACVLAAVSEPLMDGFMYID